MERERGGGRERERERERDLLKMIVTKKVRLSWSGEREGLGNTDGVLDQTLRSHTEYLFMCIVEVE